MGFEENGNAESSCEEGTGQRAGEGSFWEEERFVVRGCQGGVLGSGEGVRGNVILVGWWLGMDLRMDLIENWVKVRILNLSRG